jgi:hypothetical protein
MKTKLALALLGLMFMTGHLTAQDDASERTIDLRAFGFRGGSCSGSVFFLDDNRLILSTPLMKKCGKDTWWKAKPTRLTVIDLHGKVIATKDRADVVETHAGPLGYAVVCTENSIELISGDLDTARTFPVNPAKENLCFDVGDLSPSRIAISVAGRLFQGTSPDPIADARESKDGRVVGVTDSGFAVCIPKGNSTCSQLKVNGTEWNIAGLWDHDLRHLLFLTPEELLLPNDSGVTSLESVTFNGMQTQIADLSKFRPPFINTVDLSISAVVPRRILYYVTGCYLGDFDDCYGVSYRKFVVFDSQTQQPLFHHDADGNSGPVISPDGRVIADLDRTDLHFYSIP